MAPTTPRYLVLTQCDESTSDTVSEQEKEDVERLMTSIDAIASFNLASHNDFAGVDLIFQRVASDWVRRSSVVYNRKNGGWTGLLEWVLKAVGTGRSH